MTTRTDAKAETFIEAIFAVMLDGAWRSLDEIVSLVAKRTGRNASPTGIAANIRDLRKERLGGHFIFSEPVKGGQCRYRLEPRMPVVVDKEFAEIGHSVPLTPEERNTLEMLIERDGCQEPLDVWEEGDLLLDGHNRLEICNEFRQPFKTRVVPKSVVPDRQVAITWIAQRQLGRRNSSEEQKRFLRGLQYKAEKKSHGGDRKSMAQSEPLIPTSEKLAKEHGVSRATIKRDAQFAEAVLKAAETHGPEAKAAILSGKSGLTIGQVIAGEVPSKNGSAKPKPQAAHHRAAGVPGALAGMAKSPLKLGTSKQTTLRKLCRDVAKIAGIINEWPDSLTKTANKEHWPPQAQNSLSVQIVSLAKALSAFNRKVKE